MASLLPAMRGKFGSTEYYIVTMPAKELTERLVMPRDTEGWDNLSIEELYQRDVNFRRVRQQITPYLTSDEDRFFGAFIVTMINSDDIKFEPSTNILRGSGVPELYREAAEAFGFLSLKGSEVLVPLDGQHRLAALKFAISGKDEKQQDIDGLGEYTGNEIAGDDCTVLLIQHDSMKSRKIFNKVNRYAKKTSTAENLITADDDIIAVIVRENIVGDANVIPTRLVNYGSNTLSVRAPEFTTLSTLYQGTRAYLEDLEGKKIDTQMLPDKANQRIFRQNAEKFWTDICQNVGHFADALADSTEGGDAKRRELRQDFVIGKPVAQWAVVEAILRLCGENQKTAQRMSTQEASERINELDWSMENQRWQQVLLHGNRVVSGRTAVNFASQVVSYWLGEPFDDARIAELKQTYHERSNGGELAEPVLEP